jgi:preprotein translocase subunit YajC
MTYLIPIIVLFLLLWLFVIRPQRRRQLQQLEMQNEIHLGDEVITAGGLHAYVRQLDDDVITVEIAPDVQVRLDRRAVAAVVHADEPEALEAGDVGEEAEEPHDLEPTHEPPERVNQAEPGGS